jgi:predicted nucleic-acid-binding protein
VDDLRVERSELAWQAVGLYEEGKADFAEYVMGLSHRVQGAEVTYTFDRRSLDGNLFTLVGA